MAVSRARCILPWKKCDGCQTIFGQNDFNTHSSAHCPPLNGRRDWTYGHIFQKRFYSFVKIFETPDEKSELFFDNTAQVSLAVAQLCDIPIGDPVLITAKNNQSVVKSLWPIEENSLSSVLLTAQTLKELDCNEGPLEVKKLERMPYPAREISLELIKPQRISENQISELKFLLSATFVDKIIASGQYLMYYYYGMNPKFKVINVKAYSAECDSADAIAKDLADVDIGENNEKLYQILPNTLWRIKTSFDNDSKKSCSDKYCLSKLGGLDEIIGDLKDAMYNVLATDLVKGQNLSCGILIHGPSGTGKTFLAHAMAAATKLPVIEINSWEVISNFIGDGENRLKSYFDDAIARAPSVILMDELQSFCPSKSSLEQEKRLLGYLLILFDKLLDYKVVVIGITRDLESIDATLRRPGRFDYEIELPVPDAKARIEIIRRLLEPYDHNVAEETIVQLGRSASHGFVGGDLKLAITLANTQAANDAKQKMAKKENEVQSKIIITNENLIWAFTQVKPSAMREILVEVPNVKWSDIGGQDDLKLKLQQVLEWPLKRPESFKRLGITPPRGILLFGPPGCSKTMIAKAVATESQLNFISVKGAELFSKWVGDSEKAVREVFRRARSVSPSVVFFDEIDAITAERDADGGAGGGSNVQERVLSQLLTEMDGVQPLANVTIIAATNRPDRIDSALLRPGRLDRKLYVPLPTTETRRAIFKLAFNKTPVGTDVNVDKLVEVTEGYSGAELVAVCSEAGIKALQEDFEAQKVEWTHFTYALSVVKPRTPLSLLKIYDKFMER